MRYNSVKDMVHSVINKDELQKLLETLSADYALVGPSVKDSVIILDRMDYDDIPSGFEDIQQPGHYRRTGELFFISPRTRFIEKVPAPFFIYAAFF
jgi:hypothetical protein